MTVKEWRRKEKVDVKQTRLKCHFGRLREGKQLLALHLNPNGKFASNQAWRTDVSSFQGWRCELVVLCGFPFRGSFIFRAELEKKNENNFRKHTVFCVRVMRSE